MKRSSILDILKGLCILVVIFTHFSWDPEERIRYLFPLWIDMAIPMCMLISGYVYTKSFLKKGIQSAEQAYSCNAGGLYKRVLRYTIPFLIAWIVELFAFEILSVRSMPSAQELFREFLCGGFGSGSYYYPVLIQLTFIFPAVYFCIMRYQEKGLLLCCALNVIYEILQWAYGMNTEIYRLLVFRYLELFSFGCYFAAGGKLKMGHGILLFAAGVFFSYINCTKGITPFFITSWQTTSFLTSLHMIPVFYWLHNVSFKCRILEIIGKASYNIFLVQMVYYAAAFNIVYHILRSRLYSLIASFAVCIVIGVLFYYIELPITNRCIDSAADFINNRKNRSLSEK